MRLATAVMIVAASLAASACSTPMGAPTPTIDNMQLLRRQTVPALALGDFVLAPGLPPAMDRRVSIRGSTVTSPNNGSYAQFLKETLAAELTAAGKLDPASGVVISGLLTESAVEAGRTDYGKARLGATFIVVRDGREVYRKAHRVEATWTSSFYGAVAIPMAMNQYTALYNRLVTQLLTDPEFQAAIRR